jgi:hypothetical protein
LEQTVRALEEVMGEKDQELKNLRVIQSEYAEIKARQLLQQMKSKPALVQQKAQHEEIEEEPLLRQQLSEKTNKILELTEKL